VSLFIIISMNYTTKENLKKYLKITDDSRDSEIDALIVTATKLVDLEL
jgi:hypothetical protein